MTSLDGFASGMRTQTTMTTTHHTRQLASPIVLPEHGINSGPPAWVGGRATGGPYHPARLRGQARNAQRRSGGSPWSRRFMTFRTGKPKTPAAERAEGPRRGAYRQLERNAQTGAPRGAGASAPHAPQVRRRAAGVRRLPVPPGPDRRNASPRAGRRTG